jgi:hypothetical protein
LLGISASLIFHLAAISDTMNTVTLVNMSSSSARIRVKGQRMVPVGRQSIQNGRAPADIQTVLPPLA